MFIISCSAQNTCNARLLEYGAAIGGEIVADSLNNATARCGQVHIGMRVASVERPFATVGQLERGSAEVFCSLTSISTTYRCLANCDQMVITRLESFTSASVYLMGSLFSPTTLSIQRTYSCDQEVGQTRSRFHSRA